MRILTVGVAELAGRDDAAGLAVARALRADGVPVASRAVVDEDEAALEAALGPALGGGGVVVVLAPPGGSAGDIVRRVLARLAGVRLVLSERLLDLLEADFARRGRALPRRLERLALLPQGAQLWAAPAGGGAASTAGGPPGWALEARGTLVAVLPLDAPDLGALVEQHLRPAARDRAGAGGVALVSLLRTTGVSAADAEERLAPWLGKEGPVTVSCLVVDGDVWVRLLARAPSRAVAEAALTDAGPAVREALGTDCYGADGESLEVVVGALLRARGLAVSTAESCTGGLVAHRLTNIPGSSRYVDRGVVVYSNEAKTDLLGVPAELIRAHGAVSAPVAEAMARGVCRLGGTACGVAITGIAGPDGGSPEKPVGTVFIGVAAPAGVEVRRFLFPGGREAVKWQSAQAALDMLRRALLA
ncbi:MAG TPA: nicotinamide-nucleotide amidohydrolase family protein [Pseudomonadales bacterium]|nr:nicotinamide-nucleotide amidohydrolase family protein [Pseudomonadales bacterium]